MRCVPFFLLALLAASTPASAQQQPGTFSAANVGSESTLMPETVVKRLMAFDRNQDGRITETELVERMHSIVVRGDTNGDRALDAVEIRAMAMSPLTPQVRQGLSAGFYLVAFPSGTTSRLHIEEAIDDLRLDSATRERTLTTIDDYFDRHQQPALERVRAFLSTRLSAEKLGRFMQLLESRHRSAAPGPMSGIGAFSRGTELRLMIEQLALPQVEREAVALAIDTFDAAVRIGDEVRSQLVKELSGVLTDDQRDDLRAALERRPVVKFASVP